MCGGGGGFNPIQTVTNAAQSIGSGIANVANTAVNKAENLASNPTLAKVAPYSALLTGKGRENLMQTYGPLVGPAASILGGPAAGMVAGSLMGGNGAAPPVQEGVPGDSGWGMNDYLASLLFGGGAMPPAAAGSSSSGYAASSGGRSSFLPWIIGGAVALVGLVVVVLLARGRK